jgi:phosphopantetheine adenylyltransferase
MDLFGLKRIKELQEKLIQANEKLIRANADLIKEKECCLDLARELRDMDNFVFRMSQATDEAQLKKYLVPLVEQMMLRKAAESKRITSIMHRELNSTYGGVARPKKVIS